MANALVHTLLPVPGYGDITNIPETGPGLPHALKSLTHIYCYMDDVITVVQGVPERKQNGYLRHCLGKPITQ